MQSKIIRNKMKQTVIKSLYRLFTMNTCRNKPTNSHDFLHKDLRLKQHVSFFTISWCVFCVYEKREIKQENRQQINYAWGGCI